MQRKSGDPVCGMPVIPGECYAWGSTMVVNP